MVYLKYEIQVKDILWYDKIIQVHGDDIRHIQIQIHIKFDHVLIDIIFQKRMNGTLYSQNLKHGNELQNEQHIVEDWVTEHVLLKPYDYHSEVRDYEQHQM